MSHAALYRLLTWMSPNYPIGAFTYSHGLEMAIEDGRIDNAETLEEWLSGLLAFGSARNDVIFLKEAYWAKGDHLLEIVDLALAFRASAELDLETTAQGKAFARITDDVWDSPALSQVIEQRHTVTHPVALGIAASDHGIDPDMTIQAYLHGFVSNLVSAAVRLVPLGQTDGQRVIKALEPELVAIQKELADAGLKDLGSLSLMAEVCSMRHETQYTRLFRS